MLLEERERIIVLLPSTDSLWKEFKPTAFVQFGSTAFRVFNCSVLSSPYSQTLQAGMAICDIKKGFNEGRNGVIVSIEDPTSYINNTDHYQAKTKNDSSSSCITWRDVLNGRKDGIQVWRDTSKSDVYRNVSKLFDNRRRTEIGCKSLLSYLYEEMYGDRLQLFHLYSSYYKSRHKYIAAQSRTQQTSINDKVTTISKEIFNVPEEATLSGMNFNALIERIDEIYKNAIQDTYTKFLPFGEPLISNDTVISMLIDYMRTLPEHFNMMNEMLGFKDKQALTKNQHLTDVHYYNRKLLFMFLSQARSVNFQNLVHFGMVIPGAKYGRGLKGKSLVDSVYNGSSTTFQTMMSKLRIMSENMESEMKKKLGDMTRFVVMMDNNQKSFQKKFQRKSKGNNYIIVTGRTFRLCNQFVLPENLSQYMNSKVQLRYIDQDIPSMSLMSGMASISSTMFLTDDVKPLVLQLFIDEFVVSLLVVAFDIVFILKVL